MDATRSGCFARPKVVRARIILREARIGRLGNRQAIPQDATANRLGETLEPSRGSRFYYAT